MKSLNLSLIKLRRPRLISFFSLASLMFSLTVFCHTGRAQQAQLSLADILIGLRSKKVSLDERNKLLSGAVIERGITFALTPEIETELVGGGASRELVEAIRLKIEKLKLAEMSKPPIMDYAYYRQRADENIAKGEFDQAVEDYNKAIELNSKDAAAFLNRGRAYAGQKSFDLAILDYNKTIELNSQESVAYFNRADIYEKRGNLQQAISDYQKVVEFDASNESAKNNLKRLQDEQQAKALPKPVETVAVKESPKVPEPLKVTEMLAIPKTVELGQLNSLATKLMMPVYPEIAQKLKAQGKVTVQIALDETGKVVSAKAISGAALLRGSSEEAARKSKFKPTLVGNQAVKATGFITYNFVDKL